MRHEALRWVAVLLMGCANTVVGGAADAESTVDDVAPPEPLDAPSPLPIALLPEFAAEHFCAAMFRCCDVPSRSFLFIEQLNRLDLDPAQRFELTTMTASQCPAVMTELYRNVVLRDWIAAAQSGEVQYVAEEAQRCAQSLQSHRCEQDFALSLADSSCFAPRSSAGMRRMFRPLGTPGRACRVPRDPQETSYFGTCDPAQGYCCVFDPSAPSRCANGVFMPERVAPLAGTCVGVAPLGGSCGGEATFSNAARVCAPPGRCGRASHRCVQEPSAPLAEGAPCWDPAEETFLGLCAAPLRCDASARPDRAPTYRCVRPRGAGEACQQTYECESFRCEGGACASAARYCAGP